MTEAERRHVLFGWGVSRYSGYGLLGLNMLLAWAHRPELPAASLLPIEPLDLDPLERRLLAPAIERTNAIQATLRAMAGKSLATPHLVIGTVNDGLEIGPTPYGVVLASAAKLAAACFVDTDFPRDRAAYLRDEYALLITHSTWNAELLRAAGFARVELVLQGVDTALFHPAPSRGIFRDRFVVFSGGKLEYRKGQDLVLKAFAPFAQRHPEALLLAAWSSPWPHLAETMMQSPHAEPMRFNQHTGAVDVTRWASDYGISPDHILDLGAVSNRDLPHIIREADVAVLPSRAECGTNLVASECIACGIPTMLSDNTGHRDLIELDCSNVLFPLSQKPISGRSHVGWGESDPEQILDRLEDLNRLRIDRYERVPGRLPTWNAQMNALGDLLLPYLRGT